MYHKEAFAKLIQNADGRTRKGARSPITWIIRSSTNHNRFDPFQTFRPSCPLPSFGHLFIARLPRDGRRGTRC